MIDKKRMNAMPIKMDTEFLAQIPEWEANYKQSGTPMIHYTPEEWQVADATFDAHSLRILGEPVMEDWVGAVHARPR